MARSVMFLFLLFLTFLTAQISVGASYNWDADIGIGAFDDLQVPYGAGTFGESGEPRADGTIATKDSARRMGTAFSTNVGMTQTLGPGLALVSGVSFMQVGSSVTKSSPTITSTYDRFGLDSRLRYSKSHWPGDLAAGASLKRTDWRSVSTAHLLDGFSLLLGAGVGSFKKFRFDTEFEWLALGRFAWEEGALDLTPTAMNDVDLASRLLKFKISFLSFQSLKFQLSVERQTTDITFNDTPAAYRSSGLEVSRFTEKKRSYQLQADHFTLGFSRKF